MAATTVGRQTTQKTIPELGQWVLRTYDQWAKNRQPLEAKWQANRDAFRGIDAVAWADPDADDRSDNTDEGVTTTFRGKTDWHSRSTIRLTKQKVMTAFALVIDAVLQGGRIPFLLKLAGELSVNLEDLPPDAAAHIDNELGDMTERIHQQLTRCDAPRQLSRAVLSAAIYGRCWAKFRPRTFTARRMVPVTTEVVDPGTGAVVATQEQWVVQKDGEVSPAWSFVSNWDIFADLEAEDPRQSSGVIHRQYVSPREMLALAKEGAGWDAAAVRKAIVEAARMAPSAGDSTEEMIPRLRDLTDRANTIRVLECWVQAPRQYVERFEGSLGQEIEPTGEETAEAERSGDDIPCLIVLAGEEIVRLARLEPGEPWPFYSVPWEEDIDEAETYGVADNLRQTQAVLNSAVRCFEDNKRFSSSIILGLKRRMVNNPNWDGKLKPGLLLDLAEDARQVGDAVSAFQVPDVGQSLLTLIEMFIQFGDEESMTPKIQSGGRDSQQTAYEASIRVEKAGKYMGAVVKNFDEYLIGPSIRDFYEWNMLDPAVQSGKGAFDVYPLGFTSFQDRVIRLQAIQQFLGMVLADPELRRMVKLDDALREVCKALDLDPDQWLKSVQQLQAEAQNDPQAAAAQLAVAEQKATVDKLQADTVHAQAQTMDIEERLKIDRALAVKELKAPEKPQPTDPTPPAEAKA